MAFDPTYNQTEARVCATHCSFAYLQENTKDRNKISAAIAAALADGSKNYATGTNWELVWLGLSALGKGNLMYMAANKNVPGQYVIAHRGTNWSFISDIAEDLFVFTQEIYPYSATHNNAIKVSRGSLIGLEVLKAMHSPVTGISTPPDISSDVSLINLIKSLVLTGDPGQSLEFFVTGHSLGGALATIYSSWLIDTCAQWRLSPGRLNFKTYTVASPTVGNDKYAAYYNAGANQNGIGFAGYRIHNLQDLVPHAFDNLNGLMNCGVPLGPKLKLDLKVAVDSMNALMKLRGVSYAPAGTDKPLDNGGNSNPACPNPPNSIKDYGCWVVYEHDMNTYLKLLGATPVTV